MATSIFKENFPGTVTLQRTVDTAAFIVGLDLHKKTTAVCVVDRRSPTEPVFQRKRLPNAELLAALQRFDGPMVVVCEAAYGWLLLREALLALPNVTFIPFDARKTAAWIAASGVKTDRIDAQVLCQAVLSGGTCRLAVYVTERASRECMRLVRHRDQLVRQRRRTLQQLLALERDTAANPYTGEVPDKSELVQALEADLQSALESVGARIVDVEERMKQLSKSDGVVARLQSIPGIGRITAFALRHKIDTIERFADAWHLSAYFGFGVREWQSGDSRVKGKIAKSGDALIRSLLVQGAQAVRFRRPDLLPLYFPRIGAPALLADRRHANRVVIAVARKNLTFAYHLWKRGTTFDLDAYRAMRARTAPPALPAPTVTVAPPSSLAELDHKPAHEGRFQV